ncbi:MAG: response regulator transcription factor [Aquihabitans sp.]
MRIILCDDHPIVVVSMALMLESRGHEVVATANHPRSLCALVQDLHPDACLLDLLYEGESMIVSALDALDQIASITDVVVVSGTDDSDLRRQVLAHGASAVACKTSSSDELTALIEGRTADIGTRAIVAASNPHFLTEREREVLQCLIDGLSTTRIAERLGLRNATVRSHVQSILSKMGVHSRGQAVALAVGDGQTVSRI